MVYLCSSVDDGLKFATFSVPCIDKLHIASFRKAVVVILDFNKC